MKSQGVIALTELIVVLAIISILAGVGMVSYIFVKQRAQEVRAIDEMGNTIAPAAEQFKLDIGFYPPGNDKTKFNPSNGYGLTVNPFSVSDPEYSSWKGPYMRVAPGETWRKDPWHRDYAFIGDGVQCAAIASCGRDSACGADPPTNLNANITSLSPCTFSPPYEEDDGKFGTSSQDHLGYVLVR